MDIIKNKIYTALKAAGYVYAKNYYTNWSKEFANEIQDEESFYYKSVDQANNPIKEKFQEQIMEQTSHMYFSFPNDLFLLEFNVEGFTDEELSSVKDDYLFDYLWEGIEAFISETYK